MSGVHRTQAQSTESRASRGSIPQKGTCRFEKTPLPHPTPVWLARRSYCSASATPLRPFNPWPVLPGNCWKCLSWPPVAKGILNPGSRAWGAELPVSGWGSLCCPHLLAWPRLPGASLTLLSLCAFSLQFLLLGFLREAHGCQGPPGALTPCFRHSVMTSRTAPGAQARTALWQAHPGPCRSRGHGR